LLLSYEIRNLITSPIWLYHEKFPQKAKEFHGQARFTSLNYCCQPTKYIVYRKNYFLTYVTSAIVQRNISVTVPVHFYKFVQVLGF